MELIKSWNKALLIYRRTKENERIKGMYGIHFVKRFYLKKGGVT